MENDNLVEIKTQDETICTLKILSKNTSQLFDEIANLVEGDKDKYKYMPVILEIENKHFQANELAILIEILTQNQMAAIGIRSDIQELIDFARFSGLAVFNKFAKIIKEEKKPSATPQFKPEIKPKHRLPKIIVGEVAQSEQVLSKDSDLVLLAPVRADADVIAHGSVSAYREMQGNVFAGVDGDEKATIFLHSFNAQLVSIAGVYKQFETVPAKLHSRSVIVTLEEGKLKFQII
ncbi:MAG: Septum site-determining protein MinC [Catillopecten margaritatus gill symbiont]|uniref:Probable septum site-determining protein MinC n=1 Tax=Catillopecten margaritatus gill symbiont TaxID=3083288 RepID=A0AAU6PFB1_9GAMM